MFASVSAFWEQCLHSSMFFEVPECRRHLIPLYSNLQACNKPEAVLHYKVDRAKLYGRQSGLGYVVDRAELGYEVDKARLYGR